MAALAPPVRAKSAAPAPKSATSPPEPRERKGAVRPKLKVSQPQDPLEHDADRAADRVMRQAAPSFPMAGPRKEGEEKAHRKVEKARSDVESAHRAPKKKEESAHRAAKKKDDTAHRAAKKKDESAHRAAKKKDDTTHRAAKKKDDTAHRAEGGGGSGVGADGSPPGGFEGSLGHARQSAGAGLDAGTLGFMQSGFGQPLDQVRVYSGGDAASLASAIDAKAFTVGHDIFFGAAQYQPHTQEGRRLLAHELAHVVQGTTGRRAADAVSRNGTGTAPGPGAGTTTGATPPPVDPAAPAPTGPPTFTGTNGKRIVKQEAEGKQGTLYLPALKIPTVEGDSKGNSAHTVAQLRGVPGPDRNPIVKGQPWVFKGKTPRGSVSARRTWIAAAQADSALLESLGQSVGTRYAGHGVAPPASGTTTPAPGAGGGAPAPLAAGAEPYYYLKPTSGGPQFFVIGSAAEVARHELVVLPTWDKQQHRHEFDVDHLHELQLGGLDGWVNFWVLDASANRSSGSKIHSTLERDVNALIAEARAGGFWATDRGGAEPNFTAVDAGWRIEFAGINDLEIDKSKYTFWTREEVQRGDHLAGLVAMTEHQIAEAGLRFQPGVQPTFLNVFSNPQGGYFKKLNRSGENWRPAGALDEFYRGFDISAIEITPFTSVQPGAKVGTLRGQAFKKASKGGKVFDPPALDLDLLQSPNLGFGLYVDRTPLNQRLNALNKLKQASPVSIDDSGISADGALFVAGHVDATIPLFAGVQIPFGLYGNEFTVSFPIPTDRLRLGPVSITEAAIELGVDPNGLSLGGAIGFEVRGVGRGRVVAGVSSGPSSPAARPAGGAPAADGAAEPEGGFSLAGQFDFDTNKFDPATIAVAYRNNQFIIEATVGLRAGSVPGLESAEVHVRSAPEGVLVDGTAILGIPSLRGTALTIHKSEDGTLEIGADNIPLPVDRIPGVSGATANIHVTRNADTGDWRVSGGGSATIGIAGLAGTLRVAVDGDLFSIAGENLTLHRGPLEGSGAFLVSNQPRDEAGNPVAGPAGAMVASGHAEASMPLGPYLRGTIGGRFLPNGELEFTGSLALPPTVDLFDRRSYERDIFRPPSLDIPIFGITAAGQRIGIFATIGGALTFSAGIGPGQLRDTALTATFNPDHSENTTVHGTANFVVPADAGLRLSIHGGIGAGIPIVSAEAGIEVGGQLGITAEASAAVTVDWSPAAGLSLEATAHLQAQPQFTFDISAYLRIVADVVITEFELYNKRWTLASFSFGPALAFGIDLPIRWTEQAGLDFDLNRIEIHRPDLDIRQLATDLVGHLVA